MYKNVSTKDDYSGSPWNNTIQKRILHRLNSANEYHSWNIEDYTTGLLNIKLHERILHRQLMKH